MNFGTSSDHLEEILPPSFVEVMWILEVGCSQTASQEALAEHVGDLFQENRSTRKENDDPFLKKREKQAHEEEYEVEPSRNKVVMIGWNLEELEAAGELDLNTTWRDKVVNKIGKLAVKINWGSGCRDPNLLSNLWENCLLEFWFLDLYLLKDLSEKTSLFEPHQRYYQN